MSFRQQLSKIKENWLIVALIIILFLFSNSFGSLSTISGGLGLSKEAYYESGIADSARGGFGIFPVGGDFAPDVEDRLIVKTASLSSEVKRNNFQESEDRLKSIVESADGFILNQNVNKYGEGLETYFSGSYTIKITVDHYSDVVNQLRGLGEEISFNENQADVTGRNVNLESELAAERERLSRYQQLFLQAETVNDKLQLEDRIFEQERRIQYLEYEINNIGKDVAYSTIYVTLTEEQSKYATIEFVDLSALIKNFVSSINYLLKAVFVIVPWLIVLVILIWLYRRYR